MTRVTPRGSIIPRRMPSASTGMPAPAMIGPTVPVSVILTTTERNRLRSVRVTSRASMPSAPPVSSPVIRCRMVTINGAVGDGRGSNCRVARLDHDEALAGRQMKDRLRTVGEELVHRAACPGAGLEAVIVADDQPAADHAGVEKVECVAGRRR